MQETNRITVSLGEYMFEFSSFERWVNKAQSWFRNCGVRSDDTICLDSKGRVCLSGKQFMRARDDGSFPIKVYRLTCDSEKKGGAA